MVVAGITGWLESLVTNLVCFIITALARFVNFVLATLGGLIEALAGLLPDMPTLPSLPAPVTTALGWVNWVFPVGTVLNVLAFFVTAWLLWQAVAIVLRWAKALNA